MTNDCIPKISTVPDDENPRVLTNIMLEATHPDLGVIGSLSAIKILRHFCRGSFLEVMDEHSDELCQFSVALFDKFGRVRPWLLEPGNRRGTGCWGEELNTGELVYLLDMNVDVKYRSRGLGSWMLEKLVTSDHVGNSDHLVCWPTPVGVTEKSEWTRLKEKQIAFFRKNGFRRIGRTHFFGFSPNPSHPSRAVPVSADAEEQGSHFAAAAEQDLSPEEAGQRFPLHYAITNTQGPAIVDVINTSYQSDPASIHTADASGFTPIHVALSIANAHATRALLQLGVAPDLQSAENARGVTPLEGLAAQMRSAREFVETVVGEWKGHAEEMLRCEFMARRAMGLPTAADTEDAYVAQRKYGCTCGVCAGGWLSKRMRFRLNFQAGMSKDMMDQEMSRFKRGVPHEDPTSLCDNASDYLPPHLHQSVFKTFYVGYQSVFFAIYLLLETTDLPLSKAAIAQRVAGEEGARFFFGKGGKIEYAFDAITDVAREQSPLGDSAFEESFGEDKEYASLPKCENDLEFDLVRRMIGLDPKMKWGPYDGEGEGEDDDDDDDAMFSGGFDRDEFLREMLQRLQSATGQAMN
ncbi:hypothetical protein LshimejAT787_0900360 [Lyophyllum shimeji]|uniref:Uncharacterized protein n=1 Tax=Lyophyllum shimeji TaxID=47721 RepID=A0A9P3PSB1_LYOSH|nr:hypothetical protein LshimejAT787_0900360 [Lyophyllum shimeji]